MAAGRHLAVPQFPHSLTPPSMETFFTSKLVKKKYVCVGFTYVNPMAYPASLTSSLALIQTYSLFLSSVPDLLLNF